MCAPVIHVGADLSEAVFLQVSERPFLLGRSERELGSRLGHRV